MSYTQLVNSFGRMIVQTYVQKFRVNWVLIVSFETYNQFYILGRVMIMILLRRWNSISCSSGTKNIGRICVIWLYEHINTKLPTKYSDNQTKIKGPLGHYVFA